MDADKLVRRSPSRPLVRLGEHEPASLVQPRLGARFPAYPAKELDFALDARTTAALRRRS